MEVGLNDDQIKSSRKPEEEVENGDSRTPRAAEKKSNCDVVVDVDGGSRLCESPRAEKVCRICHFGKVDSSHGSELVVLGCDCRGELGVSHTSCAEAWFLQKGNRLCEICGKTAKNIINNDEDQTSIFMMEWNEMRLVAATLDDSNESSRRCKRSFFNVLLGCLVVAFVLPWFFRGTDIL